MKGKSYRELSIELNDLRTSLRNKGLPLDQELMNKVVLIDKELKLRDSKEGRMYSDNNYKSKLY